jgi:aminoglycoside phosphotransferase (APT) family kinase protein
VPKVNADLVSARETLVSRALSAGAGLARLHGIELVPGGNSRETWVCDATLRGTRRKVVFRCDPDHWIRPVEMRREINGLRLAERAGVPAPRVMLSSCEVDVGRPFVITEFVAGTATARHVIREASFAPARSKFASQCGEILAKLHAARAVAHGWEPYDSIADLQRYAADAAYPSPALAGAMHWLESNQPPAPVEPSPVHRDFRLGNLMISETGIVAVLDWETCQLGDPDEDLAWLCARSWRYGSELPVAGLGRMEDLLGAYESVSGRKVDLARLHWWSVYAETRWGLASTVRQRGGSPGDAMEQAAIARRGCRQEYNVLLEMQRYVGR